VERDEGVSRRKNEKERRRREKGNRMEKERWRV
jgi:hypothetical protein